MKFFQSLFFLILISTPYLGITKEQNQDMISFQLDLSQKSRFQIEIDDARKQIVSFKLISTRNYLTLREKKKARALLRQKNRHVFFYKALELINYFPVYVPLPHNLTSNTQQASFENICHKKNFLNKGSYTFMGKTKFATMKVGDPVSGCMGLCGKNCQKGIGKEIYTQECFNHDLCHRKTKSFIGCFGELINAIPGFFFGDSCRS